MARSKRRNPTDDLIRNLCVRFNSTWPRPDSHLERALDGRGMTVTEFDELAQEVKGALLRRRTHPATDTVHEIQQLASRLALRERENQQQLGVQAEETSNEG